MGTGQRRAPVEPYLNAMDFLVLLPVGGAPADFAAPLTLSQFGFRPLLAPEAADLAIIVQQRLQTGVVNNIGLKIRPAAGKPTRLDFGTRTVAYDEVTGRIAAGWSRSGAKLEGALEPVQAVYQGRLHAEWDAVGKLLKGGSKFENIRVLPAWGVRGRVPTAIPSCTLCNMTGVGLFQ